MEGIETALRLLHTADLQTRAQVQMAPTFRKCIFYFHPNKCSAVAAHQDPFFLPPVLENRPTCPLPSSLLTPVRKRAAAILLEKVTQSHHLFSTCNERTLGSLRNGPSKVIHLILRAKLLLLQSQNEKPHPRVSCLTGDGCHLTFPAAGYWFRYQSKYG